MSRQASDADAAAAAPLARVAHGELVAGAPVLRHLRLLGRRLRLRLRLRLRVGPLDLGDELVDAAAHLALDARL